jgi:hypothetical protein
VVRCVEANGLQLAFQRSPIRKPCKLTEEPQKQLEQTFQQTPTEAGSTRRRGRRHFFASFSRKRSTLGIQPLLSAVDKKSELSYQKPRRTVAETERGNRDEFDDKLKKRREMDVTVVCIDQTRYLCELNRVPSWFPRGTRPSVELSSRRAWRDLRGW